MAKATSVDTRAANGTQQGRICEHPKPGGVVVIGSSCGALGVVRSLGRRGVPVIVLKQGDHNFAAVSRYAKRVLRWPEETSGVDFLLQLAETEKLRGWLLVPTSDDAVGEVARCYDLLATQYTLTMPPWSTLERVCNKLALHQLGQTLGIAQPWTFCPRSLQELETLDCFFPVVVKPAIREVLNPLTYAKAWRVNNREELLARYTEASRLMPSELLMIQELVLGGGETQFSYAALCCEGQVLASVVARRNRQFPNDFGRASTFVETIQDPGLGIPAERLLAATGMTGLVEVEFKRDSAGRYKLLDVNPRVWAWHSVCGRAGVDFPYLLWLLARGESVPQMEAIPGISWMRLTADFVSALQEIAHGRLSLKTYIGSFFGPQDSPIFAIDDPAPGLLEPFFMAYIFAKRSLWKGPSSK